MTEPFSFTIIKERHSGRWTVLSVVKKTVDNPLFHARYIEQALESTMRIGQQHGDFTVELLMLSYPSNNGPFATLNRNRDLERDPFFDWMSDQRNNMINLNPEHRLDYKLALFNLSLSHELLLQSKTPLDAFIPRTGVISGFRMPSEAAAEALKYELLKELTMWLMVREPVTSGADGG